MVDESLAMESERFGVCIPVDLPVKGASEKNIARQYLRSVGSTFASHAMRYE